jgi:hypothetical protein
MTLSTVNVEALTALLGIAMLLGWAAGFWMGRRVANTVKGKPSSFDAACLSLLSLLLGFVLSMSLARYDERRLTVVADSNAIGDFFACAGLLAEPVRGELQTVIRRYAELRLAMARRDRDDAAIERSLRESQERQQEMHALVKRAADAGTPIVTPLTNALNALTSSDASRMAALRTGMPGSIKLLLFIAAVLAMLRMGRQQGATGEGEPWATVSYVGIVALAFWVILDLNRPDQGAITVNQEPMERILAGMAAP